MNLMNINLKHEFEKRLWNMSLKIWIEKMNVENEWKNVSRIIWSMKIWNMNLKNESWKWNPRYKPKNVSEEMNPRNDFEKNVRKS
jgi:hypothetical protein